MPSRSPGAMSASPNAATASAARSCRPRRCLRKPPHRRTRRSTMPCSATSAAAAVISASTPRSARLRRGRDMTYQRNQQTVTIANVSRRNMLKGIAGTGAFVLAAQFPAIRPAMAYATGADKMAHGVVTNPHIFVSIGNDGIVTIVAHRAEMGNGAARTSLPMIVADELDADWARVKVGEAPGDEETYGNQDTDGSHSRRHFIQPMRQVGAGARKMLEQAAAKRWGVDPSEVQVRLHEVVHKTSDKKLGFGELAADAAALPAPALDTLKLKSPSEFRYIGKGTISIVDLNDITTGKAMYGQDVRVPGMLYASIERTPVVGGKIATLDDSAAMKAPGGARGGR